MLFLTLFQFIVNVLNEPKDKALKTYSYRTECKYSKPQLCIKRNCLTNNNAEERMWGDLYMP